MLAKKYYIIIAMVGLLALQASVLFMLGHPPICPCGYVKVWDSVVKGAQNSQHLLDWYSFSHLIFGFVVYFFVWLIGRKRGWSIWTILLVAVIVSVCTELFENTHY